jgi:hypothetical protein
MDFGEEPTDAKHGPPGGNRVPSPFGGPRRPSVDRLGFKRASVLADLACGIIVASIPLLYQADVLTSGSCWCWCRSLRIIERRRHTGHRVRRQHPPRPASRPGAAAPPPGPRRGSHQMRQGHRADQPDHRLETRLSRLACAGVLLHGHPGRCCGHLCGAGDREQLSGQVSFDDGHVAGVGASR